MLLPHGHISAALASVYVISQFLLMDYSLDSWKEQEKTGRAPYDWLRRLPDDEDDEVLDPLLFPNKARIVRGRTRDDFMFECGRIHLTISSLRDGNVFDYHVDLYPPYETCLERWSYARYEKIAMHFPYNWFQVGRYAQWLRQTLSSGMLNATLTQTNGTLTTIPTSFWLSEQCEDVLRHDVATMVTLENGFAFGRVSIDPQDIDEVFRGVSGDDSSPKAAAIDHGGSSSPLNLEVGPGRPPKFDGEAFNTEAFKIILAGPPTSQAELVKRTLDAYAAAGHRGGKPGPDWAKKRIAILWRNLGLKSG